MSNDVLVWNPTAFESAHRRSTAAPETLSAADIGMLNIFSPDLAERAMLARSKALQPPPPVARLDVDAIAGAVVDVMGNAVAPLIARIEQLESRPMVKYHGVYCDDTVYREGSLVTRQGGLWCALRQTRDTPGNDGSGWQLVVKAGRV
jgi:hypothetical protein